MDILDELIRSAWCRAKGTDLSMCFTWKSNRNILSDGTTSEKIDWMTIL